MMRRRRGNVTLFVLGDSYVDTGNTPRSGSVAWKQPYGITFPGNPSGRFSDGHVLADYIASYLGIRSPTPYEQKKIEAMTSKIDNGINFAYGGTGVFQTLVDLPNMTTQIDLLQQLIDQKLYTRTNLSSSIALVSLAGNDYATFLTKNGSLEGLPKFSKSVINQLIVNVKRINDLGIKKIAVAGIEPLGCLPRVTASSSYKKCSATENNLSIYHNQMLKQNLIGLNSYSAAAPVYIYLDLYTAFTSALQTENNSSGRNSRNDESQLKPCCLGKNVEDCGLTDENGVKKYVVCENLTESFFWDSLHPSNQGWGAIYEALIPSLKSLFL
ncbi:hypothetical protein RD792_013484 [Penstemon davidsonii]|uniref:GDSL esterase/lipase n=1 Tax=Penstemon davidsonii TaxID=160366 RepID=A0ABR0CVB2_9LAMI|nr:hypothetical protein RD792_013484 [Penstemon davidsonii]